MMIRTLAACLLGPLVMACTACGGGGGSGVADSTKTPAQTNKSVLIYAEGDSTMVGYIVPTGPIPPNTPSRTKYIPTDVMQTQLQAAFGPSVSVENHAVGGTTVGSSLNGTGRYPAPLATRLATSNAQIVLANFGINDQLLTTADQYKQDWQKWIDTVKSFGKIPVMVERNPICAKGAPDPGPFIQAERDVAKANGVALIAQYDAILAMPGWQQMLGDCLHPTDALYQIISQKDADAMKPLVKTLMN
ncbi:SGNH/GDSL hydrolase family protein [Caballeronia sp. LZ028]|uniref:SGNH/GDSL hydrolase family protein n=1 Tax=Caballeronia sp. LZ028 TaxID=3038563 RepID=UPI00285F7ACA|nr:SGNH/GDSL hydrolase family protein [Caballeronia sp. LZ028]MDR5765052.1 SGNH/GDSL hydrolase family protein [Caballeronia sp. LZ028]